MTTTERDIPGGRYACTCATCNARILGPKGCTECAVCLAARIAELERDRDRLDWLDTRKNFMMRRAWWNKDADIEICGYIPASQDDEEYAPNVREAIDKARTAGNTCQKP